MLQTLTLHFDVGTAREAFFQELHRIMQICRFLDSGASHLPPDKYAASGVYGVSFEGRHDFSFDETRTDAYEWLQGHLLQEALDITGNFVEECLTDCAYLEEVLIKKSMSIEELELCRDGIWTFFHGKSFPKKIELLRGRGFTGFSLENVQSLNRLRNCLVHRRGVVSKKDAVEGHLNISFLALKITAVGNITGKIEVFESREINLSEPSATTIEFSKSEKRWSISEKVVLSRQDISNLIYTLVQFADECTCVIREFYRSKGILKND